jgi:phosphate-selective porin OprO/OprP
MTYPFRSLLLASAALAGLSSNAFAASKSDEANAKLDALERSVADLRNQLQQLKQAQAEAQAAADSSAALADLKRSTSGQYADLNKQIAAVNNGKPKLGFDNGRLTVASADGRFSLSLRSLVQYDYGYFSQGKNPATVDLNSGGYFRRAQFGFVGTAWRDWSYNFTYDFGGNGTEKSGYIYTASLEYDGLKPFVLRIGAFAPPEGLEDATGSGDLIFLERPATADTARNVAGAPGRDAVMVAAQGDNYLAALSYTGNKAGDSGTFDEQQALVGRLAWLAVNQGNFHWLLDADGTYVFKLPDAVANAVNNPANHLFSFSNGPELAIDATKTVNTGTIDASKVNIWSLETAANWNSLYGQAGYFHYSVTRRASALPNPGFKGWYVQGAYALTGETKRYDPSTASFRQLSPSAPLGEGGIGAWELAARYSNLDLNYLPLVAASAGGIGGGNQNVWTLGLNWYPTSGIRFALDYDNIRVHHPNAPANDLSADAIALRSQVSF